MKWSFWESGEDPKDPSAHLNRHWCWQLSLGVWNGRIYLGIEKVITQFEGKAWTPPRTCRSLDFSFVYNPRKWELGQTHSYYDGPHCTYNFGPFSFNRDWNWCKKCMPED